MTTLITGATGHLGRLIVEALLARGVSPSDIVATGRQVEKLTDFASRGIRIARVDYDEPSTITDALAGVDTVVLVSGSEVGKRAQQHAAVIDAAKAAGVQRIVYTSAPKARTSPLILAPDHKATEELIEASGIPATILRNGWYTENYAGTLAQARATQTVVSSTGDGRVASASRKDFAEAVAAVLTTPGHDGAVYELSGDIAWTHDELAAAIGDVIGAEVVHRSVTPEEHHGILLSAGLDEGTAGFLVALDQDTRAGLLAETSGDLARLIGRPTTPLREGLAAL